MELLELYYDILSIILHFLPLQDILSFRAVSKTCMEISSESYEEEKIKLIIRVRYKHIIYQPILYIDDAFLIYSRYIDIRPIHIRRIIESVAIMVPRVRNGDKILCYLIEDQLSIDEISTYMGGIIECLTLSGGKSILASLAKRGFSYDKIIRMYLRDFIHKTSIDVSNLQPLRDLNYILTHFLTVSYDDVEVNGGSYFDNVRTSTVIAMEKNILGVMEHLCSMGFETQVSTLLFTAIKMDSEIILNCGIIQRLHEETRMALLVHGIRRSNKALVKCVLRTGLQINRCSIENELYGCGVTVYGYYGEVICTIPFDLLDYLVSSGDITIVRLFIINGLHTDIDALIRHLENRRVICFAWDRLVNPMFASEIADFCTYLRRAYFYPPLPSKLRREKPPRSRREVGIPHSRKNEVKKLPLSKSRMYSLKQPR
jgi:hypothetical protein